jgi:hypothetical protein
MTHIRIINRIVSSKKRLGVGSGSRNFYQNTSLSNQSSIPQLNRSGPHYIASAITEFMQGQEKMNQVIRKQLHAITAHLVKLNAGEQGSENSTNASTSANRDKLPNKSEISPREEAKVITSKDEFVGSEFLDV